MCGSTGNVGISLRIFTPECFFIIFVVHCFRSTANISKSTDHGACKGHLLYCEDVKEILIDVLEPQLNMIVGEILDAVRNSENAKVAS